MRRGVLSRPLRVRHGEYLGHGAQDGGMATSSLLPERLRSHRLSAPARSVTAAAAHMLAVQSQDFMAGRWALATRTKGEPTLTVVDRAFKRGELVRAWTMRGTLHIIPARDLGWVLQVTADRQRKRAATRHRELGIDHDMVAAAARVVEVRLRDGGLTRTQLFDVFESIGIEPGGQRGIHLLNALTLNGLICQGPVVSREGISREQLFVLVEQHISKHATPVDPLAELFVRYIDGHGPAGVADFAWWSGLTLGQSREARDRALDRVGEIDDGLFASRIRPRGSTGAAPVVALGAFDEFYISYADRTVVCAAEHLAAVGPGKNGMVRPLLIERGRAIGTWSHASASRDLPPELWTASVESSAVAEAIARFSRFAAG
jgi:hypothetical protein